MSYIDPVLGYVRTRLDQYLASLQSQAQAIFGSDIDLGVETPDGQWLGIFAESISDLDQLLEQTYNSSTPAGATGAALARLVRLNGIKKKDPAFATVEMTLTGVTGTVVPKGTLFASSIDPTAVFASDIDVTISGSTTVSATATVSGSFDPAAIAATTITVMRTVINGLTSVNNVADATNGDAGETDAQLRARQAASVALPSLGIVDGLEAALRQLPNVEQAVVRENPEDTTQTLADGGTLVAHAIQVIVKGGDDTQIANTIWLKRSAGCTMVGATVVSITDIQGVAHDIKFDRPTDVPIYVAVHSTPPLSTDVKALVAQAIEDRGNGKLAIGGVQLPGAQIGQDVRVSDVYQAIAQLSVTTVPGLQVDEIDIGIFPSPTTDTPVTIAFDHIASWLAGNVSFP